MKDQNISPPLTEVKLTVLMDGANGPTEQEVHPPLPVQGPRHKLQFLSKEAPKGR